jgi:hypothetical protein
LAPLPRLALDVGVLLHFERPPSTLANDDIDAWFREKARCFAPLDLRNISLTGTMEIVL